MNILITKGPKPRVDVSTAMPNYLPKIFLPLLFSSVLVRSQNVEMLVTNPTAGRREHEPVIVRVDDLLALSPGFNLDQLTVTDGDGRPVVSQRDDLDGDGKGDELVFVVSFKPRETKKFILSPNGDEGRPRTRTPSRTTAAIWKKGGGKFTSIDDDLVESGHERTVYRYDGVGWESELVGYRLYLDERNAIDVFGKHKPDLVLDRIGSSDGDYHHDSEWGMDVLHVGNSLGIGGIAIWRDGQVLKPEHVDGKRCRIVARGPVRSVVSVDYDGWEAGPGKINLTSLLTIYAGEYLTEHRVKLRGESGPIVLATGIVKHDSAPAVWSAEKGLLYTLGVQSEAGDSLMLALNVPPSSVIQQTEDADNHLVLLELEPEKPVSFYLSSLWQGEARGYWSQKHIEEVQSRGSQRLNHSLRIQVRWIDE